MSKNLTRKGLALGALVALGSTVIAGPAFAIDPVSLAPSAGTAYSTVTGETFNLVSRFTDAAQVGQESLKFLITDSASKLTSVNGQAVTLNASKQFITVDATDKTTPAAANNLSLTTSAGSTTDVTVTVQAWLDYDDDGVVDSDESASAVRTIKFVKIANAGLTTTLSAVALSDLKLSASIKFNADINVNQLTKTNYQISFGSLDASGVAGSVAGDSTSRWAAGSTDSGDTVDVDDATAATALSASTAINAAVAKIYVAQAVYVGTGTAKQVGDPSYYTVGSTVAYSVDAPGVTVGDNVSKDANGDYNVRTGTKTVSFAAKVTKTNDAADAQVGAAGIVATVTVSIDTIDADDTISAGDKTFAGVAGKKSFTVTSNADGKFLFDVASVSGKKGTEYTVSLAVPGLTAPDTTTIRYIDAAIVSAPVDMIVGASDAKHYIVKGGSVAFKLAVLDSFGAKVSGDYRVDVTGTSLGDAATAVQKQFAVVDGYADVSFTDASTISGNYSLTAKLQVKSASAGNYVDTLSTSLLKTTQSASVTIYVVSVAKTASKVTVYDAVGAASIDAKDFKTGDLRVDRITATGAVKTITLTGDVTDVLGAAVPGATVTIAAEGVQFIVNSNVYAVGSVTVTTNENGHYSVVAVSHKTGKVTFTATSGAATKTGTVTYDAAAANSGTSLVVTAPASAVPGKTVTVSAKLTDKWGNAVTTAADKIAFTSTGAGYFVSKATTTDSTGVAEAVFITQPSDAGTVKFTVKYSGTDATADNLTTSASTVFAAAVVVDPSASVATVTVTAATTSQAGRALDVTVKAVDAAGAAVAGAVVALSSTGAGSLSASSVVTNAAGTATVKLVAGSADLGSAVVTATSNGKSSAPATVEFGATDASVDIIGKRVYVTTEFAAGKRVTIYDNGVRRYSAIQTSDAEKVVMWNVKAGSHTIVVKISGASSDSVTFLVK